MKKSASFDNAVTPLAQAIVGCLSATLTMLNKILDLIDPPIYQISVDEKQHSPNAAIIKGIRKLAKKNNALLEKPKAKRAYVRKAVAPKATLKAEAAVPKKKRGRPAKEQPPYNLEPAEDLLAYFQDNEVSEISTVQAADVLKCGAIGVHEAIKGMIHQNIPILYDRAADVYRVNVDDFEAALLFKGKVPK